jgi:hypothetical protein
MITLDTTTNGIVDWDCLIKSLYDIPGSARFINDTIDSSKTDIRSYQEIKNSGLDPHEYARPAFKNMVKNWVDSGYNFNEIMFENYYPDLPQYQYDETHFSKKIIKDFEKLIGYTVYETWISRVDRFSLVPFHRDEYDKEQTWLEKEKKTLERFMVFIDKPIKKQIFLVDNYHFENIDQHTIIKWPTDKSVHTLINCSDEPNFLFHFLGYKI